MPQDFLLCWYELVFVFVNPPAYILLVSRQLMSDSIVFVDNCLHLLDILGDRAD